MDKTDEIAQALAQQFEVGRGGWFAGGHEYHLDTPGCRDNRVTIYRESEEDDGTPIREVYRITVQYSHSERE